MDPQTLWSAALIAPAVIFTLLSVRARRQGRTRFGLGIRHGAVEEFFRGCLFSLPFLGALLAIFSLTGLSTITAGGFQALDVLSVVGYFLILMLVEEIVFRGLLMTGLGVFIGRAASLVLTSVLVAGAYLFAPHTSLLAMVGAVVTNLLHGWARWRSGRIWWGWGQRWVWNAGAVAFGFADSGFQVSHPVLAQHLQGPAWLTGGEFGVEAGVLGIVMLMIMLIVSTRFARGRFGLWQVEPRTAAGVTSGP